MIIKNLDEKDSLENIPIQYLETIEDLKKAFEKLKNDANSVIENSIYAKNILKKNKKNNS